MRGATVRTGVRQALLGYCLDQRVHLRGTEQITGSYSCTTGQGGG
jgi:hypothetical protein